MKEFKTPDLLRNEKVTHIEIKKGEGWPLTVPVPSINTIHKNDSERLADALKLLEGYESIEALLIGTNECWGTDGVNGVPTFTHTIWDAFISLQSARNGVLQREGYFSPTEPAKAINP